MKVTIYSRNELDQLLKAEVPKNTALIRFFDAEMPEEEKENRKLPEEVTNVFEIELDDIDKDELEELEFSEETFFPEAKELARFICHAHEKNLDIICQCEYGQSRSAGCAAAILEFFYKDGISVFRDYRYFPNKLIFNKVFEALKECCMNADHTGTL